ncbi:MAG: porphobilinogen synthase [Sedimentisphaerales bacterium]
MAFPNNRMRRLRKSDGIRRLVRETAVTVDNLVYPLFVRKGRDLKEPIESMVDCFHFSPDTIVQEAQEVAGLGIPAILLFGLPDKKDKLGSEAWAEDGAVQSAIKRIKDAIPELVIITDVCLCGYTSTGHCGVIKKSTSAQEHKCTIDNDATIELLAKVALSHAQAGADIVAPSDMMDGRVKAIRECLEKNDFPDVAIMSYAAKFASAFYGPFRDAAESAPDASTGLADRKTYQMDPANARQAMAEIALDIEEGADIVMVKPALPYLDIIYRARQRFDCPLAAYNVSGEYMMVHDSANAGHIEKDAAMMGILTSIKRAGADIIITYFAKDAAKLLKK